MSYKSPSASTTNLGSMRVGAGLAVTNGTVSTIASGSTNYGFFSSNTTQANPDDNVTNIVTFNTTGPVNGVSIVGGNAITCVNAGTYTKVFTLNITKTSGGTSSVYFWLKLNGVNVTGSTQVFDLTNTLSSVFVSGNYTLTIPAGGNIQLCWSSSDESVRLASLSSSTSPSRPTGSSAKVTVTRIG